VNGRRAAGDEVLLREIWQGSVWSVRPVTVARDTPGALALYIPPGTRWLRPRRPDGGPKRIPGGDWILRDARWYNHVLRVTPPGEPYSVMPIWGEDWVLRSWYINIEEPVRPSAFGYDYMDWTLDVIVAADFSGYHWKDETEMNQALKRGVYDAAHVQHVREAGERAIEHLLSRRPPFDEGWDGWRPDPRWGIPPLPERWE
jgi:hypothetical protein